MSIQDLHPLYSDSVCLIQRCRDVYEGQSAIKAINGSGVTPYFPMYHPPDQSRYNRAVSLSSFTNYTGRTVDKLVGAAFIEQPQTNLAESKTLSYMLEDADGFGNDIQQIANNCLMNNLIAGRHVLLVNYPATSGHTVSKEDVKRLGLRASIHQYKAESLVNWGVKNNNLWYVVLTESKRDESDDMFSHESTEGRRVYYMKDDGLCYQQFVEDGRAFMPDNGELVTDFNGSGLNSLPVVIIGSVSNTPEVDKPPILDMADVNIAHYQISTIETENLAIHGQTTIGVTTSFSAQQFREANPDGIHVGANKGLNLGSSGGFHTATAPESSALPKAKESKVAELVALGASLTEKNDTAKTAKEVSINAKEQTSVMQNIVNNVSDAIETCLVIAEQMMSPSPAGDVYYRISTEFYLNNMSHEMFLTFLAGVDREIFTTKEIDQAKKRAFPMIEIEENGTTLAEEGQ